jgi:hypothetical protein
MKKPVKNMNANASADGEKIVRKVIERIKVEAPHADPIIIEALIERIRANLSQMRP